MRKLSAVLVLVIIAVSGCGQVAEVEAPAPDLQKIHDELVDAQMKYAEAWCNKDMAAISTMWSHDDDISLWGPAERDRVQGWEGPNGVKAWYEAAMATMDKVDFKINGLLIKVGDDGTSAIVTYYVENDFVDYDGNAGKMTPRVTVVKVIQDGEWKQVHGDASFSIAEVNAM
ncbi:hypothetical protein ES708_02158 [subsurface metagenome]